MITFSARVKVNTKEVMDKASNASHKRIGLCATTVEREAKILCSKGGGKASPPQKREVQYYYGEPLNRWVRASPAGAPPYSQTSGLKNSITWEYLGRFVAAIGPTVLYGKFLEYGTRKMAQRPFMRPALRQAADKFADLFRGLI